VTVALGDAGAASDVARLATGDVVISATRPAPGREAELVTTATALLAGLAGTGVRLLLVGGAATLRTPSGTTLLDDPDFPVDFRPIATACAAQLACCRANSTVDWTYLSPAERVVPGPRTGVFRLGTDELLVDGNGESSISTGDLAAALLDEAETPRHYQTRYTVGY
jgi:uncharacterized protein